MGVATSCYQRPASHVFVFSIVRGLLYLIYAAGVKKQVVEAVIQDGLSYQEAARIYEVQGHDRIQSWERIYLEEGPEGLAVERRGRKSTGRPKKLPSKVEEDLLAEVQRLRAETAFSCLNNFFTNIV